MKFKFMLPPLCLDSAYERKAIEEGLVKKPVFAENKYYVTEQIENNEVVGLILKKIEDYHG